MNKPLPAKSTEPAFTLNTGDLFHKIAVTDPFLCELMPDTKTVITIISIRRATGYFSVKNVIKSFQKGKCVSRSVQRKGKPTITLKQIDNIISEIQDKFGHGIFAQADSKMHWETLDLSKITDRKEQLERIKKWGRLNVS